MGGEGALNGGMMARESPIQSPLNSIGAESVDQTLKQIAALGGKVVVPKTAITHMVWAAHFEEAEGNRYRLWQVDRTAE